MRVARSCPPSPLESHPRAARGTHCLRESSPIHHRRYDSDRRSARVRAVPRACAYPRPSHDATAVPVVWLGRIRLNPASPATSASRDRASSTSNVRPMARRFAARSGSRAGAGSELRRVGSERVHDARCRDDQRGCDAEDHSRTSSISGGTPRPVAAQCRWTRSQRFRGECWGALGFLPGTLQRMTGGGASGMQTLRTFDCAPSGSLGRQGVADSIALRRAVKRSNPSALAVAKGSAV